MKFFIISLILVISNPDDSKTTLQFSSEEPKYYESQEVCQKKEGALVIENLKKDFTNEQLSKISFMIKCIQTKDNFS